MVTTIGYVFSPAMNKNLHIMLRTQLVTHIILAIAEVYYPLPYCVHIHFLVSVQHALINGYNLFCMTKFSHTFMLFMYFDIRQHFVRMSVICIKVKKLCVIYRKVQPLLPYGHHNKIGDINFGTALMIFRFLFFYNFKKIGLQNFI